VAVPFLSGPYALTTPVVDIAVAYTSPGAYVLGYVGNDNVFYVQRTGRSDTDVNSRLKSPEYIGHYRQFKFTYAKDDATAFAMECELWHAYGAANNPLHPARPKGKDWKCPCCKNFG